MSGMDRKIICRRCAEPINLDIESCPHCGADIRGRTGYLIALVIGLVIVIPTLTDIGDLWPYTLVGVLIAFGGAYFLYDRRQRIQTASETG